jgi:predicted HTH transcriptional regulator
MPKAAVKVYRYTTTDAVGSRDTLVADPVTVEGHLYKQIKDAVETTTKQIEGIQTMGPQGLEDVQYPPETLHEIITNAVLHRDYAVSDDVHVRIFDNRVEVESPGDCPHTSRQRTSSTSASRATRRSSVSSTSIPTRRTRTSVKDSTPRSRQ